MKENLAHSTWSVVRMLLVVAVFGLSIYFFTVVFVSQDVFWFQDGFSEKPVRILVYHNGERSEYRSGSPDFEILATAIQESLNHGVLRQSGIGMSEETLQDAYQKYVTVEAFFIQPVKVHANYNTGRPTQMIFPITGRHSELSVVFFGENGSYRINGPVLKDMGPIREALKALDIDSGS